MMPQLDKEMSLSQALEAMKEGATITRAAWASHGLFLYLNQTGNALRLRDPEGFAALLDVSAFDAGDPAARSRMALVNGRRANGCSFKGWIVRGVDAAATDWAVL